MTEDMVCRRRGRRLGLIWSVGLAIGLGAVPATPAADGDLDPLWDGDGIRILGATGTIWRGLGTAIQCDGKVLVTGSADGGAEDSDLLVARFDPDGSLDGSFATGGVFAVTLGTYGAAGWDLAIQPDGRIVVAGTSVFELEGRQVVVLRLTGSGDLDPSFSGDGRQILDFGGPSYGRAVALQDDGKILVAGDTIVDSSIGIARLTTTGELDTAFDGDGRVLVDFTLGDDEGWDVAVQDDGRILVVGTAGLSGGSVAVAIRLLAGGALDTSFGPGSGGATPIDFGIYSAGRALALQPDGRIVIAGLTDSQSSIAVARLTDAGLLDASFGGDGMVTRDFGSGPDEGWDVAVQGDGRIVVAGSADIAGTDRVAVLRYLADGTRDAAFGGSGYALVSLATDVVGRGLVVQPDDAKLVVAGYAELGPHEAQLTAIRLVGDSDLVFTDGFECGDVSAWSSATP